MDRLCFCISCLVSLLVPPPEGPGEPLSCARLVLPAVARKEFSSSTACPGVSSCHWPPVEIGLLQDAEIFDLFPPLPELWGRVGLGP